MENDTLRVHPSLRDPDYDRVLDWLTALLPVAMMSVIYYRVSALALLVTAVGGYLMASRLLAWAQKVAWEDLRVAPALLGGSLAAFCLPEGAPWWLSALFGGIVAAVEAVPHLIARVKPAWRIARPVVHPVLFAYLLVRVVFPARFAEYTMPAQFISVDGLAGATPLAALHGGEAPELWKLLFGVHAGAIGETCTAAILLGVGYLLLRRRIRLIAPACLLATVALLSWILWGAIGYALYALLVGGLMLTTLLFADAALAPALPRDQIVTGVIAGVITVLIRFFGGWAEGVVVGVLAAQMIMPLLPYIYKGYAIVWTHIARVSVAVWTWAKPYIVLAARFIGAKSVVVARWMWAWICHGAEALISRIKELLKKNKNNS